MYSTCRTVGHDELSSTKYFPASGLLKSLGRVPHLYSTLKIGPSHDVGLVMSLTHTHKAKFTRHCECGDADPADQGKIPVTARVPVH